MSFVLSIAGKLKQFKNSTGSIVNRELRDLKVVVPKDLRLYLGASIGCCESWIYSIFTLVHFH